VRPLPPTRSNSLALDAPTASRGPWRALDRAMSAGRRGRITVVYTGEDAAEDTSWSGCVVWGAVVGSVILEDGWAIWLTRRCGGFARG
jgi:hypothetical protein